MCEQTYQGLASYCYSIGIMIAIVVSGFRFTVKGYYFRKMKNLTLIIIMLIWFHKLEVIIV